MTPATLFGVAKSCDACPFLHRTSPCRDCTAGFRCDIMSLRALTHLSHHRRFLRHGTENSFVEQHCATRRYGATPRRGKPADMAQQDRAYCTSCFGVFVCACVTLASGRTLATGSPGSRGHADSDFNPHHPLTQAQGPPFYKILLRCPSISPASRGDRTGLCYDPGRWLARECSGHVCRTRGHANWTGFGQSGSFHGLNGAHA